MFYEMLSSDPPIKLEERNCGKIATSIWALGPDFLEGGRGACRMTWCDKNHGIVEREEKS